MKTQLEFEFTPTAYGEMSKLRSTLSVSDDADVVRLALRTLRWVIEQQESGASIQTLRGSEGQEVRFAFLDWTALREKARLAESAA